jgi:hypothetical protein
MLSKKVPGTFSAKHIAREREKPLGVQGIVAESPQDLHWQIRGLGAESPVFLPVHRAKKGAQRHLWPETFFFRGTVINYE